MWRLVAIVTRLIFFQFLIQAAAVVSARVTNSDDYHELLAPYTEIMPGQLIVASPLTWCISPKEYYEQYVPEDMIRICQIDMEENPIMSVSIYSRDTIIRTITFRIRGLSVGDLARQWGRPMIQDYAEGYFMRWEIGTYRIMTLVESRSSFSYLLLVDFLTVRGNEVPGNL